MRRKIKPVYVPCNCCMICANPYDKGEIVYFNMGMVHRTCLKKRIKYETNALSDDEIEFLIDTEVREYQNYKKETARERCLKNINKRS